VCKAWTPAHGRPDDGNNSQRPSSTRPL